MKILKFLLTLIITVALGVTLNTKIGPAPPIGKFLSPASGFWQNAEPADYKPVPKLNFSELKAPVTVTYDKNLMPHIFADNNHDLYFAQGYVTAVNRLWQMEFQTHAAAGRLSEIVGAGALDFDRTARRKGMVYAAEQALVAMEKNAAVDEAVSAYAEGVNAYINTLNYADYPLEYKLLDYAPETWTSLKSALLLKYMASDLNFHESDLENTNALKLLGREVFDILYPDMESAKDPIVENINGWNFPALTKDTTKLMASVDEFVKRQLVEQPNPLNGSNNWAVGPAKTAGGNAILANDPHLSLSLPSIWYIMQLSSPDVNTMGATLPGSPNVISGFNDSIAWGVTNAQRDLVDWYKIEFKDGSKEQYKLDGDWVNSKAVVETIKIKGKDTYLDTVYYTHFGPVLFDDVFHPDSEKRYYALRWIAHDPSEEALAFYQLNRAKNHADYMEALEHYVSPAQNFAFASVSGDIAMRIQGKYPLKAYEEGKFLLDGTTTIHDWKFIPNDQNIMYKNPERNFISSANQYPVDSTYPYYVHASSYETYRNRRINDRLGAMKEVTTDDMKALQNDNFNLKAAESLPVFLKALDSIELNRNELNAQRILSSWDYYNEVDSEGATYYEQWWDMLCPMIWDELYDKELALRLPTTFTTIRLIKEFPEFALFDDQSTDKVENARDILIRSFKEMVVAMVEWKAANGDVAEWADFKGTYVKHLLSLPAFGRYNIPIGGNHNIVNATSANHGPSWRMIVELDKQGVKAYGLYPGGQSGNPGSRFYDNMIDKWAAGEYYELHLMHSSNEYDDDLLVNQELTPQQ